jgi:hypothetical protein
MGKTLQIISLMLLVASCANSHKTQLEEKVHVIRTIPFSEGTSIQIEFEKGVEYYNPLIVFWIEDTLGNYIETVYASQSIATGTFKFGDHDGKNWKPGERRRAAALPYWGHKRGIKAPDGLYLPTPQSPLPDGITGATPSNSFIILTTVNSIIDKFNLFMEINQTWDWNQYWHNNRFPNDDDYLSSCQPALVYAAEININSPNSQFTLHPIGHSHHSGKTGELFKDLTSITTALNIVGKVTVTIKELD